MRDVKTPKTFHTANIGSENKLIINKINNIGIFKKIEQNAKRLIGEYPTVQNSWEHVHQHIRTQDHLDL